MYAVRSMTFFALIISAITFCNARSDLRLASSMRDPALSEKLKEILGVYAAPASLKRITVDGYFLPLMGILVIEHALTDVLNSRSNHIDLYHQAVGVDEGPAKCAANQSLAELLFNAIPKFDKTLILHAVPDRVKKQMALAVMHAAYRSGLRIKEKDIEMPLFTTVERSLEEMAKIPGSKIVVYYSTIKPHN
jgi:hypothetical protein